MWYYSYESCVHLLSLSLNHFVENPVWPPSVCTFTVSFCFPSFCPLFQVSYFVSGIWPIYTVCLKHSFLVLGLLKSWCLCLLILAIVPFATSTLVWLKCIQSRVYFKLFCVLISNHVSESFPLKAGLALLQCSFAAAYQTLKGICRRLDSWRQTFTAYFSRCSNRHIHASSPSLASQSGKGRPCV